MHRIIPKPKVALSLIVVGFVVAISILSFTADGRRLEDVIFVPPTLLPGSHDILQYYSKVEIHSQLLATELRYFHSESASAQ